jgi:hypothetical protein
MFPVSWLATRVRDRDDENEILFDRVKNRVGKFVGKIVAARREKLKPAPRQPV